MTTTMIDIDFEALRAIGLGHAQINQFYGELAHAAGNAFGRIVEVHRDRLVLHDGTMERNARALPSLIAELGYAAQALAVGDWVAAQEDAYGDTWITARMTPLSQLARRANDGRRQTLVSNVDTALLVMGLDHDFNLRRLERYAALVKAAGVEPVVVLTKADSCPDADEHRDSVLERLGRLLAVLAVDARAADAAVQLAPWCGPSKTLVLIGSSGAGKSTLTNTLTAGEAGQQVGSVRLADGRGRHTTRARCLFLCHDGSCIIDTPGLRTWRPDADEDGVTAGFEDIEQLAAQCRFRDCQHVDEPGCAVRQAISADRLRSYHKLVREARRGAETMLERKATTAKWKVIAKAGSERARQKRSV
jgi:ribosome biogenesis GTPase